MFITNNFDNFLKADQASDKITINGKLRKWQIYHSDFKELVWMIIHNFCGMVCTYWCSEGICMSFYSARG